MGLRRNTRKTVEDFLEWAFDADFRFQGVEWADEDDLRQSVDAVDPPPDPSPLDFTMIEGPLVRLRCVKCGNETDAWLDERGDLEDWRDAFHWHHEDTPVSRWNREWVGDDDAP